jgi:glycine cleavage system aminomethyltransferase T
VFLYLTPVIKHLVSGPDAFGFMNRLATRDIGKTKPGQPVNTFFVTTAMKATNNAVVSRRLLRNTGISEQYHTLTCR